MLSPTPHRPGRAWATSESGLVGALLPQCDLSPLLDSFLLDSPPSPLSIGEDWVRLTVPHSEILFKQLVRLVFGRTRGPWEASGFRDEKNLGDGLFQLPHHTGPGRVRISPGSHSLVWGLFHKLHLSLYPSLNGWGALEGVKSSPGGVICPPTSPRGLS